MSTSRKSVQSTIHSLKRELRNSGTLERQGRKSAASGALGLHNPQARKFWMFLAPRDSGQSPFTLIQAKPGSCPTSLRETLDQAVEGNSGNVTAVWYHKPAPRQQSGPLSGDCCAQNPARPCSSFVIALVIDAGVREDLSSWPFREPVLGLRAVKLPCGSQQEYIRYLKVRSLFCCTLGLKRHSATAWKPCLRSGR